jgi:hypothetical protein
MRGAVNVRNRATRGMTIIEVIFAFGILLLILSFITLFFKQAFTHMTLTTENMTNEQLARIAMAKINNSLSQASVDTNSVDLAGGAPANAPVLNQTATSIAFFRVTTLVPGSLGVTNSAPDPLYNVHVISYDNVGQTIDECFTTLAIYNSGGCPAASNVVLARNVTNFSITKVTNGASSAEYQFQLQVSNVLNPTQAESPYTLVDNVDVLLKA